MSRALKLYVLAAAAALVLAVTGTTGTGWVNPTTVEALEYMYGGDTAIATMQYSYMPSWASFMVDRNEAGIATTALFDAIYERWLQEPEDERPTLLVFGESLSVAAIEAAFDGLDDMIERTDGALLIGAVFTQILLGILTILSGVKIDIAVAHQGMAALLLAAIITAAHRLGGRTT